MAVPKAKSHSNSSSPNSLNWWQWILMYPTLGVAVLGAMPTVVQGIKAISIGTTYSEVPIVERNATLFENNWKCLGKSGTTVQLADNTKIEVAVCDKGDIWIRSTTAESQGHVSWVTRDEVLGRKEARRIVTRGLAAPLQSFAQNSARPLCVFKDKSGKIVRRIVVAPGNCRDEQIDPYTGRITSVPADCSCPSGAVK
jgi:hypothetical protein